MIPMTPFDNIDTYLDRTHPLDTRYTYLDTQILCPQRAPNGPELHPLSLFPVWAALRVCVCVLLSLVIRACAGEL